MSKEKKIELQLGDIIQIIDPTNERLHEQTFLIEYLDPHLLKITNVDSGDSLQLPISEESILGNGTIQSILLLSRDENKGYAKQNHLVPGTWINIHFGGEVPSILTGEITNLEEDMIEITIYPEGDVIYINFDYQGIPVDLPIESIEIREKPEKSFVKALGERQTQAQAEGEEQTVGEVEGEAEQTERQTLVEAVPTVRKQIREMILKADQIQFGTEEFGPIVQYTKVDASKQRFSIEVQTNDLLDELLSTIPNTKRTHSVLNNIHTMIERFKQLRQLFSHFDEYGNVITAFTKKANYKPLEQYFQKFQQNLYWILPVVKNIKKIYTLDTDVLSQNEETNDTVFINLSEDLSHILSLLDTYRSNTMNEEQNKYSTLYHDLNPSFTPFDYLPSENQDSIILEKRVETNIHTIIDNLTNLYSSVFSKNEMISKRFLIEKYNLGLQQLENIGTNKNQTVAIRVPLTEPDTMSLHSFITLPEPIIKYSRIQLPGTSILERSTLNGASLQYWLLLKKTSSLSTILVDQELEFNENNFANQIKEFILGQEVTQEKTKRQLYDEFTNHMIPKTRILFQSMKKYIHGSLSILEVVKYLEPFLVYTDDLTYRQYVEMTQFINEKISEFNKSFLEKEREMNKFKRRNEPPRQPSIFSLIQLLQDTTQQPFRDEVTSDYDIVTTKEESKSDSEILQKMLTKDESRLFTLVLAIQNKFLMFPMNMDGLLEQEDKDKKDKKDEKKDSCKNIIVSKFYISEKELLADNEKDIFFDKKYDQTNYGILNEYEKEMLSKSPEDFLVFLTGKLADRYRLNDLDAENLAETLLTGFKKVQEGHYAIVYQNTGNSSSYTYYIRKENKWTKDDSAIDQKYLQSVQSDDSGILCDLQPNCIQKIDKYGEKCESLETNQLQLKEEILHQMLGEFDQKYAVSKQIFEEAMMKKYEYYSTIWFPKLAQIEKYQLLKYNNQRYEMGLQSQEDKAAILSPYAPLRDIILGQQDFVKKQNDLIKFVELFCRKSISNSIGASGDKESEHWLYCVKTNIELLPIFYYDLACAFMNTPDQYYLYLQELVAKIGALSDDEKAWVDKYTGREICKIDDSFEEGFNDGFKVSTRAILQEDIGNRILVSSQKTNTYDTVEMKVISNIVNAISVAMGINLESQKDFIISGVLEALKSHLEKEETYKKRIKEMANKGATIPSYQDLYNTSLLFFTLGMFLLALQTSIPSVKTRKTFPGCVRSFSGYPFDGPDDLTSVHYLACVVYAIRKNSADPWTSIKNTKEVAIANKIKNATELLLGFPMVKTKIDEKTAYLLLNPETEISMEHDLSLWKQFLPPLVPFKIKRLSPISADFESSLLSDLKNGNSNQREKILVIESKNILFSLAIQEKIHEVVSKKDILLNKANREPYLENACCDEKSEDTFIGYFEKLEPSILQYNRIVNDLTNILFDIRHYTEAQIFYSNINTKNIYPPLNQAFDEKTIYLGFIHFCRFNTLLPMDDDLLPLCTDKPTYLNRNESLNEMIQKLKNDGRNYTDKMFLRLLQVISRKNIVPIDLTVSLKSSLYRLTDTLEAMEEENDEIVEKSLRDLMINALDTFDIATDKITEETKNLNNFLMKHIGNMKKEIVEFIISNKGAATTSEERRMSEFFSQWSEWNIVQDTSTTNSNNKVSNDSLYTITQFYKNMIQDMVLTFPTMILNQVDYNDVKIPAYWGLSQKHASDIKRSISEFYQCLRGFYNDLSLTSLLKKIQRDCINFVKLAKETPSFSSIYYKGRTLKPVFDERTSQFLFEYYLLRVFIHYIDLSEDDTMITQEVNVNPLKVEDLFTVEYLDEQERKINVGVSDYDEKDLVLLRGNVKQQKQKTAKMLLCYLKMMNEYKDTIDVSYQNIQDRIFKLKEKEKIIITDRLEFITDEERDADTILKVNKLGVWSKGLQKGLKTYVKEDYDDEREFMETMMQYEKKVTKKVSLEEFHDFKDDYLEEIQQEEEIDREAYDMSHMTEDYMDGNDYEGEEVEDYEDYN